MNFGLTSGVITTLGLMVGLHSGTHSRLAVIGGILTIAVADALSDALAMHISEESENRHTVRQIWISTGATFTTKLLMALTFMIPVLLFELSTAIIAGILWGLCVVTAVSYRLAKTQGIPPWKVIGEHVFIALLVIAVTHLVGDWVRAVFT